MADRCMALPFFLLYLPLSFARQMSPDVRPTIPFQRLIAMARVVALLG